MRVEERIGELLTKREQTLAIAESLTGGLVTSMITDVPGSSTYL
ncbi:MAG: CinA family protein, partial [Candidatus Thermoplasmatota archaeon]|nr:CinA family protein [Candidatus Thermoplasmatota archaeon]